MGKRSNCKNKARESKIEWHIFSHATQEVMSFWYWKTSERKGTNQNWERAKQFDGTEIREKWTVSTGPCRSGLILDLNWWHKNGGRIGE